MNAKIENNNNMVLRFMEENGPIWPEGEEEVEDPRLRSCSWSLADASSCGTNRSTEP